MNIIRYPERPKWKELLKRSALHTEDLRETVCKILGEIRAEGDRAVIRFEEQFDKVKLDSLEVTEKNLRKPKSSRRKTQRGHYAGFEQYPHVPCRTKI